MKFYKRNWINAGIGYRRDDIMILKPDAGNKNWLVRLIHGAAGQQRSEGEATFTRERKAFRYANRVIRRAKKTGLLTLND